ncbi:MAG TPA: alanine racemase [Vicinamibacterales bacterium]|nr:alanine racemase [Vicinamibacterales bacterium]
MKRRQFLSASLALPGLGLQVAPAATAPASSAPFDPWVEVHAGHLRANAAAVRGRAGVPILAVIKNNGYGAGVVTVAQALSSRRDVAGFAVVKLQEAVALRDAGLRHPVLLMGPFAGADLTDLVRRDIALMVYTPVAADLARAAAAAGREVNVHVCVDTGLGRVGVPHHEAPALIADLARTRGVRLRGVMMTFTEDEAYDREQLRRFHEVNAHVQKAGIPTGPRHAASSYTLFQHPDAFLDMVRPGMALYGIYPEAQFRKSDVMKLTPALALKARVAYVKQLQPGESAGYNRAYMAKQPVWIATLPVGHADGLPRAAAKGGRVRIGGALYPIVASVSASHTIVEIGPERRVEIGDEATLFDWTEGSRPEDLAERCGASVYDLTMHLNPLLPRRVV